MSCTLDKLTEMVAKVPLTPGKHEPGDEWCILEARSQCAGIEWTDDPQLNRTFDFRHLNDMSVSDSLRTEWMPRVMAAYEGSLDWPIERQIAVASKIAILTVNLLVGAAASTLPEACAAADLVEAQSAHAAALAVRWVAQAEADQEAEVGVAKPWKAASAVARAAVEAALAAAGRAEEEAWKTVRAAARTEIFIAACQLWIEAASC